MIRKIIIFFLRSYYIVFHRKSCFKLETYDEISDFIHIAEYKNVNIKPLGNHWYMEIKKKD